MTVLITNDVGSKSHEAQTDVASVALLEDIRNRGRVWNDLAAQYGVTNPDPPWKVMLDATCDILATPSNAGSHEAIVPGSCALPLLERRAEEDDLSATIYADVPFPERQLLALAHSMIKHGLLSEEELARQMEVVGRRLKNV